MINICNLTSQFHEVLQGCASRRGTPLSKQAWSVEAGVEFGRVGAGAPRTVKLLLPEFL